jgi:hypothetical protein
MIWLIAYVLIELHGPGGQNIIVNTKEIVELRDPQTKEHFGKGVHCIINTSDGKFSAVSEDCDTVRRMIEGEHK